MSPSSPTLSIAGLRYWRIKVMVNYTLAARHRLHYDIAV